MIPAKIDITSEIFQRQYALFLGALAGAFARSTEQPDPTTAQARSVLAREAMAAGKNFTRSSIPLLEDAIRSVSAEAVKDSEVQMDRETASDISEHVDAICADADRVVSACVSRDIYTASHALRKLALRVDLASAAHSSGKIGSIMRARFKSVSELEFKQSNAAGRFTKSDEFAWLTIRWFLLHAYTDSFVLALARNDIDLAAIDAPGKEHDGLIFSISGSSQEHPSYDWVKEKIFHPRSSAGLKRTT